MSEYAELQHQSRDYARVERAISYLEENFRDQPELETVAEAVGLSATHFQRMFKRWAGISPKRFVQYLTLDHARRCLADSASVLDASYDSGLSGPGRLHDLFVTYEAMTPGDFKREGDGIEIVYGVHPSPFGPCFIGETERGVCALGFADDAASATPLEDFRRRWCYAKFREDHHQTAGAAAHIFGAAGGKLALDLRGTNFQLKVWEALLRIPPGAVVSYDALAGALDKPGAARAVGGAVAANPVSYLIPCHRVIRKSGRFHNYYWGPERKRAMLAWEAAHFAPAA
ncbi:MAG: methylated-DNA--[protein]-cysteine S-methyltransferase [Proteobacteria bacterium]|nr:methylated-DNA--[protein]-cysteine S-methyltransferase [Pseudomonadota bacterium]MDA1355383.1 methylated-DNA--[protein]-cysteine S-methyltransferase [Pseudomonadota bacterium]